ncbi:hypothetical protein [Streptomyces sp. NPDC127033]
MSFGRDRLTDDLVSRARRSRLISIVGPSGSGRAIAR